MRLDRPAAGRRLRPARRVPQAPKHAPVRIAGMAIAAVAAAALAGWLAGGFASESRPDARPLADRSVRTGPVEVAVAGEWRPVTRARSLRGLDPARTRAFAPLPGLSVEAVLTLAEPDHPSLLPAAVRTALEGPPRRPLPRPLAGRAAWRYRGLPAAGGLVVDAAVVPTSAGVLTVACVAPEALRAALADCSTGIRSLSLRSGSWLPPADDLAMRSRLPAVVRRLDRARVSGRAALRRARTPAAQRRRARRLAGRYARAANVLAPLAGKGPPAARVTKSLRRSAAAYRRLGAAASRQRPRAYRRARTRVRTAERALGRAVRSY